MVNLEDFKLIENGPGLIKTYKVTCIRCNADRGYKRLREQDRLCSHCAKREKTGHKNLLNVDLAIFKIKNGTYLYKTICIKCKKDRGFKALHQANKKCGSCSQIKEAVEIFCDICGKSRGIRKPGRIKGKLCRICFGFTLKGRIFTEETKQKMRDSNWIKKSPENHPWLGRHHSEETKAKLSVSTSEQNRNRTTKFLYEGKQGQVYMKSSWEIKFAYFLDKNSIDWTYEPKFTLSNGLIYLPDFQLSSGVIIEIKGYMRPDAEVKWQMFEVEYPGIKKSLFRKEDLKRLGVID